MPLAPAELLALNGLFSKRQPQAGYAERTNAVRSPAAEAQIAADEAASAPFDEAQRADVLAELKAQHEGFPSGAPGGARAAQAGRVRNIEDQKLRQSAEAAQIAAGGRLDVEREKSRSLDERLKALTDAVSGTNRSVSAAGVGSIGAEPQAGRQQTATAPMLNNLQRAREAYDSPMSKLGRGLGLGSMGFGGRSGYVQALQGVAQQTGRLDDLQAAAREIVSGQVTPEEYQAGLQQMDPNERQLLQFLIEDAKGQ